MKSSFFATNRKRLMKELGEDLPVVVAAHGQMQMSRDTEYPFEQDRSFFYLTGLELADWILVIDGGEEYLIAPEISEIEVTFNGSLDENRVRKDSGVQTIVSSGEGWIRLKALKKVRMPQPPQIREWGVYTNPANRLLVKKMAAGVEDITDVLLRLRTIKQLEEISEIRKAISISGEAFKNAKESLSSYKDEAELEAVFTGYFAAKQTRHGYSPIVASGVNACTLHYTANNDTLARKGLVLVDIGARSNNYSADITRTWELSSATRRHHEVREVLKIAFNKILRIIKPGLGFEEYKGLVDRIISDALSSLGLESNKEALQKYLPHAPTHGLGLDVHDPIVGFEKFEPGMVVTLEPGIYIPEEGIGVRHEDDLLITEKSVENLSGYIE